MCDRYGYQHPYNRLVDEFSDVRPVQWAGGEPNAPSDQIRPTERAPILRPVADGLELVELRWGLIPWFHKGALKDFRGGLNTNARSETVSTLASFKGPYAHRRCLVPANYYFEWTGEKRRKTMWKFTVPAQEPPARDPRAEPVGGVAGYRQRHGAQLHGIARRHDQGGGVRGLNRLFSLALSSGSRGAAPLLAKAARGIHCLRPNPSQQAAGLPPPVENGDSGLDP
jgi:hypothetical protein